MKKHHNTRCRPEKILIFCALMVGLAVPSIAQDAGWEAFERGRFVEASEWARNTLSQQPDQLRARHLRILTSFLTGDFEDVLAEYLLLPAGYEGRDEALARVILDAYLHLDRYQEATAFAEVMGFPESQRAWLEVRAARPPTVRLDRATIVPFAEDNFLGDLMPAVVVQLNGTRLVAHLDTGGAFITMSGSRARELGIEVRTVGTGVANNQRTSVAKGLADSLTIGDAALTNVEVATVQSLTGQLESIVILGTRILSNFLTTWDNEQGRLILTPRDDVAARIRHLAEHTDGIEGVDLYLRGDHHLWVNGNVDGHNPLMFLDTGLVTLDPRGNQPAGGIRQDALGDWDLSFTDGFTRPVRVAIGPVSREVSSFSVFPDARNLGGLGGVSPPVLISHGFFKHYVWTMDFDERKLYLRPAAESLEAAAPSSRDGSALQAFVGSYEVAPGVALEVTKGDDGLLLQAPEQQRVPMVAGTEVDTFEIPLAGATIVFSRGDTNQVTALVLNQAGNQTRATRVQ
ncbi:MAG: aspartyl protease family protein [Acidobacteriota bacterium]|nr:aspartyl protease family protein [Acidobacteriota bacterium]